MAIKPVNFIPNSQAPSTLISANSHPVAMRYSMAWARPIQPRHFLRGEMPYPLTVSLYKFARLLSVLGELRSALVYAGYFKARHSDDDSTTNHSNQRRLQRHRA